MCSIVLNINFGSNVPKVSKKKIELCQNDLIFTKIFELYQVFVCQNDSKMSELYQVAKCSNTLKLYTH